MRRTDTKGAARLRAAVFAVVCSGAALTWIALSRKAAIGSDYSTGWPVIVSVTPALVATSLLISRLPGHVITRLMTLYVASNLIRLAAGASAAWFLSRSKTTAADVCAVVAEMAWFGTLPLLAVLVAAFPSLPAAGKWLWAVRLQIGIIAFGAIATAVAWPERDSALNISARVLFILVPLIGVGGAVRVFIRRTRAPAGERQQLNAFAWTALATIALYVLGGLLLATGIRLPGADQASFALLTGGVPTALAFAVLRHRLYGIDLVVNRVLLWASLTAVLVGLYLTAAQVILRFTDGFVGSVVPALITAGALAPLRAGLQRGVDLLMYGDREEPHRALRRLGDRLAALVAPGELPDVVVRAVREAVRAPFVRLEIKGRTGDFELAAESGRSAGGGSAIVELRQGHDVVGRLIVEPRPGESELPQPERRLLDDLAKQAAVAVTAAHATAELERSRDRLVRGREAERDRLRRDVHDGLSPSLAGIALMVKTCENRLNGDEPEVRAMLARIYDETQTSIDAVRRLLADLRPASLDELGLIAALRERADHLSGVGDLVITVETLDPLPALRPAVELAAYRIAVEAMANAARHASATTCVVRIDLDDTARELVVAIDDDGVGIPADHDEHGGLASIRERSLDVGGHAEVHPRPDGGTRVLARLPLGPAVDG